MAVTKIEKALLQVRHVRTFLDSAEAALRAEGNDNSRIGAARIAIEGLQEAYVDLLNTMAEDEHADGR